MTLATSWSSCLLTTPPTWEWRDSTEGIEYMEAVSYGDSSSPSLSWRWSSSTYLLLGKGLGNRRDSWVGEGLNLSAFCWNRTSGLRGTLKCGRGLVGGEEGALPWSTAVMNSSTFQWKKTTHSHIYHHREFWQKIDLSLFEDLCSSSVLAAVWDQPLELAVLTDYHTPRHIPTHKTGKVRGLTIHTIVNKLTSFRARILSACRANCTWCVTRTTRRLWRRPHMHLNITCWKEWNGQRSNNITCQRCA